MHRTDFTSYLLSFVETPRKFIIAELSIRKLGSSSVLIIHITSFTSDFTSFFTSFLSPIPRGSGLTKVKI